MDSRRRVHDGIVGILVSLGTALGYWASPAWLLVPGAFAVLLIQSWFTGFCPELRSEPQTRMSGGPETG